ncbi:hypothetical protein OG321_00010 [Streptomyces sp. NBC_00424]|uniref:hypothetical protein n=1 Tax=Streptomyces sp. NBC_00424 TaxID=2903648 RepID=UPI002251AC60|nr:hypothetical protein [Streptomyces sp. NBC_00424]MCX5070929.1 hypothetical protein [Streptomyces sp. NBC_00424]
MSITEQQQQSSQPQQPAPQPSSGTDPVQAVTLVLVVVLFLGMTGYVCVVHPALADAVSAVGEAAAALLAVFALAFALRRR